MTTISGRYQDFKVTLFLRRTFLDVYWVGHESLGYSQDGQLSTENSIEYEAVVARAAGCSKFPKKTEIHFVVSAAPLCSLQTCNSL